MWEMRGEPRHHLSSKVLCWTALDRAVKLAPQLGEHAKAEEWAAERDEIRDGDPRARLERGASRPTRSRSTPTSSTPPQLLMPILGFLPATDERMRSTIEAIARELTEDGLVLRYRNDGGAQRRRPHRRGGHVRDLLVLARLVPGARRARSSAPRRCSTSSPATPTTSACSPRRSTPPSGEQLGNFPQAFSHIGLITAAVRDRPGERSGRMSATYDVDRLGGGPGRRALRRRARRRRPAGRDRRARAARRRVLLLGLHPVQDAAAPGRGAAGARARRPARARRSPASVDAAARLRLARLHGLATTTTPGQARWARERGHRRAPRRRPAGRARPRSRSAATTYTAERHRDRHGLRPGRSRRSTGCASSTASGRTARPPA